MTEQLLCRMLILLQLRHTVLYTVNRKKGGNTSVIITPENELPPFYGSQCIGHY